MFSRCFAIPKQCKTKIFLDLWLAKWANSGLSWLRSSVLLGLASGSFGAYMGVPDASALILLQHSKIAHFRHFGAIAFPRSSQISVLRGFLGGFFGFIGAGCIFGCLAAFVGLVGLYACAVRRLRTEKRNAAHFLGFIGLIASLRSCCCFLCFVLLLLRSCCLWVSLGLWVVLLAFFPFGRYDKKKGQAVACPLFVGCVLFYPIALGITKLLQAVSILRELPTIQAAVNCSLL